MLCLKELREQIDEVDQQLCRLLDRRMKLCDMIGQVKVQKGIQVENADREAQILSNIKEMDLFYDEHVRSIMLSILKESKDLQNSLKR